MLGNFVNYGHPVTGPFLESSFSLNKDYVGLPTNVFLGYIPILLILLAITRRNSRRELLPWLILVSFFLVMRLGSYLSFNGVEYKDLLLPKHYLSQLIPHIFEPYWSNEDFHSAVLLPWAILSCYGLAVILRAFTTRRRQVVILALGFAVAFEYYQTPSPLVIRDAQFAYTNWLKAEENQDSIHVINLPMGEQVSKHYDFHQTLTGYPHVEGRPTRTPPAAFNYIKSNFLLESWRRFRSVHCLPSNQQRYNSALDQLVADGFTHIVLHRWLYGDQHLAHSFASVEAAYRDESVSIYRIGDMRQSCDNSAIRTQETLPHYKSLALSTSIVPDRGMSALSLHPSEPIEDGVFSFYTSVFSDWESLIHLYYEGSAINIQSEDSRYTDLDSIAAENQMLQLFYDPSQTNPRLMDVYMDWSARAFFIVQHRRSIPKTPFSNSTHDLIFHAISSIPMIRFKSDSTTGYNCQIYTSSETKA